MNKINYRNGSTYSSLKNICFNICSIVWDFNNSFYIIIIIIYKFTAKIISLITNKT